MGSRSAEDAKARALEAFGESRLFSSGSVGSGGMNVTGFAAGLARCRGRFRMLL